MSQKECDKARKGLGQAYEQFVTKQGYLNLAITLAHLKRPTFKVTEEQVTLYLHRSSKISSLLTL